MDSIILTRQQLFDLVWKESLLSLSKQYLISDVGLRKICKDFPCLKRSIGIKLKPENQAHLNLRTLSKM